MKVRPVFPLAALALLAACGGASATRRDTARVQAVGQGAGSTVAAVDTSWAIFPEQLHWKVSRENSPVDGALSLRLEREGRDTVLGTVRPGGPIELSIRCYSGRPTVRLLAMADASAESEIPVKYRLDGGRPRTEYWPALTLGYGGEAPEPRALLRAMLAADTFHVERVFGSGSMASAISVRELRQNLPDIKAACGVGP